jgi:hypothetical protein
MTHPLIPAESVYLSKPSRDEFLNQPFTASIETLLSARIACWTAAKILGRRIVVTSP